MTFFQPGSYSLAGVKVCGIETSYAPVATNAVDSTDDDPAKLGGGTTEGNYPDSEAFQFTPATSLAAGKTITVSLPDPAEPYPNSGSVLPAAQVQTQVPTDQANVQADSTIGVVNDPANPDGYYITVTLHTTQAGTPDMFLSGNKTVQLDAFDPYNPPALANAPGPGVSGPNNGTSATIVGLKTASATIPAQNPIQDPSEGTGNNTATTELSTFTTASNGEAEFYVTADPGEDIVFAATDEGSNPSAGVTAGYVGLTHTAELDFGGLSQTQLNNPLCSSQMLPAPPLPATGSGATACPANDQTSTACGAAWLLIENNVGYYVSDVSVGSASGVETASLLVPPGLPSTSGQVTLVALDAISPPGEGTPTNPVAPNTPQTVPDTPYAPDAFSISTTEDPVPGYPMTAPVFTADATGISNPVDGTASTLTTSGPTAQAGSDVTATATLRDVYNNPVNDTPVSVFQSGAGHADVAPQTPPSDGNVNPITGNDGTVAYSVSDSCAETVNVEATDTLDNVLVDPSAPKVPVTFTAGPAVAPDGATTLTDCGVPSGPTNSSVTVTVDGTTSQPGTQVPAPADGKTQALVTVTLGDQFGNPVPCQQVILAATTRTSGATISPQSPPSADQATQSAACPNPGASGYTGVDGKATFAVTDSTAENVVFGVTASPSVWPTTVAKDVAQINFESVDTSSANSTVVASPAGAPADGQPLVTVTVTLKDKAGQPVQGKNVTLAGCTSDPTGSSCTADSTTTITPSSTSTDGSGQATFKVADSGPGPRTVYYQATDVSDGLTIAQVEPVTFSRGGVGLTASPATVIIDGSTSTLTFTLKDSQGNPLVPGVPVSVSSSSTTATISPVGSGTTDSTGAAAFTVNDTQPEEVSFNATATYTPSAGTACVGTSNSDGTCTVTDSVSVNFIGVPYTFSITASPATGVTADGVSSSQVTVKAVDSNNNAIAGLPVSLAANAGSSTQITPSSVLTDSSGDATFEVTDEVAETAVLSAGYEDFPASGQPSLPSIPATNCSGTACTKTVTFVNTAEAKVSTISASPGSAPADGNSAVTVTVTLLSGYPATPISGHSVVLMTGSSTAAAVPTSNVGGLSDANGMVTFAVTDTRPESLKIYARDTNTGVILSPTASVTFQKTEPQLSTVTASPATLPAGGPPGAPSTSTVTVTLFSAPGVPISGHTVTLTANSLTAVVSPVSSPAVTDSNGVAEFTVSDPAVETVTLTAVDTTCPAGVSGPCSLTLPQTATVSFVATETNQSTAMISPVSTPAEGPAATLTVTLLSGSGAPISGHTVTVPAVAHATVTPLAYPGLPAGVTNAYGQVQFAVSDNTVETVTLVAYDGATQVNEPAVVAFTANEANQSTMSATPASLPALGATTTVTVTLTSGGGAPIAGHNVMLASSSPTVSITPATAMTNASGRAQFTVSDPDAESVVLTAVDQTNGVIVVQTLPVTFTANEQNQSTATASPAVVQEKKASTITVTLLGANDQPLAGHAVALTTGSTTTKVTVLTKGGVTTATGQIQFSVTDTAAETVSIMVTDTTTGVTLYLPVTVTSTKP